MALLVTKIPYGDDILISSTAIVNGKIWNDRVNQSTMTEDFAEMYARIVEMNVAYQTGLDIEMPELKYWPYTNYMDYFPGWKIEETTYWNEYQGKASEDDPGGYDPIAGFINQEDEETQFYGKHMVSSLHSWTLIYDHILNVARKYAITGWRSGDEIRIMWLDSTVDTPVDGDPLATAEVEWSIDYVLDDRTVYKFLESKAYSPLLTTDTRVPNPDVATFVTQPEDIKTPFTSFFYPGATLGPQEIFEPSGNWWTHAELGGQVYKLWPETVTGWDDLEVRLTTSQGGFSIDPSTLVFKPKGTGSKSVAVESTDTDYTVIQSALYKATADGLDDAYFVATDGEDPDLDTPLEFSATVLTIDQGEYVDLTLTQKYNPYGMRIATFSVIGEGIYFGGSGLYFFADTWNSPRTQRVYAATRSQGNTAAVIAIGYGGKTYRIAVEIKAPGDNEIEIDPTLVSVSKGSKSSTSVYTEVPEGIHNTYYDKRLHRKTWDNLVDILTPLKRTVAWVPADCCTCDTVDRRRWRSGDTQEDLDPSDLWSHAYSTAALDTSSTEEDAAFHPVLYDSRTTTEYQKFQAQDAEALISGKYTLNAECALNTGVHVPYPSAAALDGDKVNKVTIYAVTSGSIPRAPLNPIREPVETASVVRNGIDAYDDIDFGVAALSPHGPFNDFVFDTTHSYGVPQNTRGAIAEYRLQLMASGTSAEDLKFDMGSDELIDPGFGRATSAKWTHHLVYPNTYIDRVFQEDYINQTIRVLGFLVIVEWKWTHLGETPFKPEVTNSPGWTEPPSEDDWEAKYTKEGA